MTEVWKPVVGFEGLYEVSDQGRVRSLDRTVMRSTGPAFYRGRVLRKYIRKAGGYHAVVLSNAGEQQSFLVHFLVAAAFLGERPVGQWVAHNDGTASNNYLGNLRYDTPRGNQGDKLEHGTLLHSERHHNARLTSADVAYIRTCTERSVDLAEEFGVNPNHIYRIRARKRWKHAA